MKNINSFNDPKKLRRKLPLLILFLLLETQSSCRKLIEIAPPTAAINTDNVFTTDATAASVLTGIYTTLSRNNSTDLSMSGLTSMSLFLSLSADELSLYDHNNLKYFSYYSNNLSSSPLTLTADYWKSSYPIIFTVNSAIEGLEGSNSLTPSVKKQLLGEAKFIRALYYFYLVNLYGDVPLVLSTDYKINSALPRSIASVVYQQIIDDLKTAQSHLNTNYLNSDIQSITNERIRPNKWAATALLARVYLYTKDWVNAENQANAVINNSSLYNLTPLTRTFLKNSAEAIWQLQPVSLGTSANTGEGKLFILPSTGPDSYNYPVYLSNSFVRSFEKGDQRRTSWVDSIIVGSNTFYYPYKYKIGAVDHTAEEYTMILRLGELYLIRAEARANLGKLPGAVSDINAIRNRAGISNTKSATKISILQTIQHERQVELFTEWGHRWLDLKRTNTIDEVMRIITPQKNGIWQTTDQLYPIPLSELQNAPQLLQNTGY